MKLKNFSGRFLTILQSVLPVFRGSVLGRSSRPAPPRDYQDHYPQPPLSRTAFRKPTYYPFVAVDVLYIVWQYLVIDNEQATAESVMIHSPHLLAGPFLKTRLIETRSRTPKRCVGRNGINSRVRAGVAPLRVRG